MTFKSAFAGSKYTYAYVLNLAGLASGWQPGGSWTVGALPPSAISVSPSAGSGLSQIFTATYSDPLGYANITEPWLLVQVNTLGASGCWAKYNVQSNAFYLSNDAGTAWSAPVAPGGSAHVENSQCVLSGSNSTASGSGNTLTVKFALGFKTSFNGAKYTYLYVTNQGGAVSGWQLGGSWTVGPDSPAQPPSLVSVSPSSGSGPVQTFSFTGQSVNGFEYINQVLMLFNTVINGGNACYIMYDRTANAISLINDAGNQWLGGYAPGTANTISNSHCSIDVSGTSAVGAFNTITVAPKITFFNDFVGVKNAYMYINDAAGQIANWQVLGTWTPYPAPPVPTLSVSPASGSGMTQVFTFHANDVNGYAYVAQTYMILGPSVTNLGTCYLYYSRASNTIYLENDAGTSWGTGVTPGGGTLSSSQCRVNASGSGASGSGNDLAISLSITFNPGGLAAPGYVGADNTFMYAYDNAGQATGWKTVGSWTIPNTQPDFSVNIAPASGTVAPGNSVNYTVTLTGTNGFSGSVNLSASGLPSGASASFSPATITGSGSSTLTISTVSGVQPGNYSVTANGTSGSLSHGASAMLNVAVDFSLSISPTSATVTPGGNVNYAVTVAGNPGFNSTVSFTASGLPSGASASFSPTAFAGTGSTTLTISTTASVQSGSFMVTATSGVLIHSVAASLTVSSQQPDFSLSMPTLQTIPVGMSAHGSATITQLNGFNSPVTISWTNQSSSPPGMFPNFSQNPTMTATTITVSTMDATPAGTYTLSFMASGGGSSHPVNLTVTVASMTVNFFVDDRLVALNTGITYAHFATWTDSTSYTNQTLGPIVLGPSGGVLWGPTDGPQTTGSTPSVVDYPAFRLADIGFGSYTLSYNASWGSFNSPVSDVETYPAPFLSSISPAYGTAGSNVNVTIKGQGLGASDLDLQSYRGITSIIVSGTGVTATFSPSQFVAGQLTGNNLQVTIAIASSVAPGTYSLALTAFGYTSNALSFTIADATPQITGVAFSQPLNSGGSADIQIYGYNFGLSGDLAVCRAGAGVGPCTTNPVDVNRTITSYGCYPSLGYCQLNATLTASASSTGPYDLQISSNGSSGQNFMPPPDGSSQTTSNRAEFQVGCGTTASVILSPRAMDFTGPFPHYTTLHASGQPSGGTYQWTTDNPNMIHLGFDNSDPSGATDNTTVNGSGKAQITVQYTTACGATAQDSFTLVVTDDVTVVGWIDGSAISLPSGASSSLVSFLNTSRNCPVALLSWAAVGLGIPGALAVPSVTNNIDRQYANAWLNQKSANFTPPNPLFDPSGFDANKNAFRAFNRFEAYYEVTPAGINAGSVHYLQNLTDVGQTPEPCSGFQVFGAEAERHSQNGSKGPGPQGAAPSFVYQVNEGRVGSTGQAVNAYLNHPEDVGANYLNATPFIWSVTQFDQSGNPLPLSQGGTAQIFPTYYVYRNGGLVQTIPQGALQTFISLSSTSFYMIP